MSTDRNECDVVNPNVVSLLDWDMSTDRNILTPHQQMKNSLLDWDMSTDRNIGNGQVPLCASLLDWDMSTDRNGIPLVYGDAYSLLDWDMSTDRNVFRPVMVATSDLGTMNSVLNSSFPDISLTLADAQFRYENRPRPVTNLDIVFPV